jgi:Ca2+/Na+ antiporter
MTTNGTVFTFDRTDQGVDQIFNQTPWIDANACNHAQLLIVTIVYGVVLYQSSNLIANGSEFLLLVPSLAGMVGSIVLPILGAVPDGMMTLCSGLQPTPAEAQATVGAGVGVLAGSTVMLLTFPWFIAVTFGRAPIENGKANFSKSDKSGLLDSGITYDGTIKQNAALMLGTTLLYLIIQVPAWFLDVDTNSDTEQAAAESKWAAIGGIASLVAFMGYLYICFLASKEDKVLQSVIDGIKAKKISLGGALEFLLSTKDDKKKELLDDKNLKIIMRPFFAKYDADNTGDMEKSEFMNMLRDLDDNYPKDEAEALWKTFDQSGDGLLTFQEFCRGFKAYLERADTPAKLQNRQRTQAKIPNYGMAEEEDGEEEIPEDLADLPYEQQQRAIKFRAAWMMALGTFVVVVVSDPFVDVLTNWGDRLGISPFYVSFVVAPFASNASELLSAYTYAKKKTKSAITTSLSTLIGAACMNNTFCLGIFYGLIYFGGLAWKFKAETIAIILIQWIIGILAMMKDTQAWVVGFIILAMYPFCLFVVYYLENVIGWD